MDCWKIVVKILVATLSVTSLARPCAAAARPPVHFGCASSGTLLLTLLPAPSSSFVRCADARLRTARCVSHRGYRRLRVRRIRAQVCARPARCERCAPEPTLTRFSLPRTSLCPRVFTYLFAAHYFRGPSVPRFRRCALIAFLTYCAPARFTSTSVGLVDSHGVA